MADKNMKAKMNVEFTEATSRQSIESGDSVNTLFGKIKKFFSDLKSVAFSGSYNDLSDKPTIPTKTSQLSPDWNISLNFTAKTYYHIAKSKYPSNHTGGCGYIRLHGVIGGWSSRELGAFDLTIKLRNVISGIVTVKDSTINYSKANIVAYLTDDGYTNVYLVVNEYSRVAIYIDGNQYDKGNSNTTKAPVGTKVFDLSEAKTEATVAIDELQTALDGKAEMNEDGTITANGFNGNATSATALLTSAGSATQPVYFSSGKPVACTYTLGKSVPSNAVFTDTNTWRGIQDNLTSSTNTTESLSAKQGYLLANGSARDNTKLPLSGGTVTGNLTVNGTIKAKNIITGTKTLTLSSAVVLATASLSSSDLGFAPTANTSIIATIRKNISPTPLYLNIYTTIYSNTVYFCITNGAGTSTTVPSGTYYIDYIITNNA